jgi:hypothetical protein
LTYQTRDAHLVYSDHAKDVSDLSTSSPYSTFHVGPWTAAYQTQDPFRDVCNLSQWKCWPGLAHTTAFLHKRRSAGGFESLVSVILVLYVNQPDRVLSLDVAVTPRPHLLGALEPVIAVGRFCHLPARGQALRVFMGQPDPNDESRFTIDIELDGSRSTLVGILRDDGSVAMYFPKTFADFVKD